MGFIDKALEKARAERDELEGSPSPPPQGRLPIKPLWPLPETWSSPETACDFKYSTTRTVPVEISTLIQNRLIVGGASPMVHESYKLLRTHILQKTLADHRNTIMVTSPLPNEGKTLTSINLAISLAQELSQTVLLVDADLRLPSVHRYFGFEVEHGLVDYLAEKATIPELLVHPQGLDRLVILPAGQTTDWAAELIRSPRMAELVHELKHCYPDRYVLFDLPPMLSYADALAFAPLVDGIILVVEARKTQREDLLHCREMLADLPVLGYVFNKAENLNVDRYYRYNGKPKRGSAMRWLFGRGE